MKGDEVTVLIQARINKINMVKQYGNQSDWEKDTIFQFNRHNSCPKPSRREQEERKYGGFKY